MGLDMYLSKRTYIGAEYEHRNVKGMLTITAGKDNKIIPIQFNRISYIEESVGYWRKANHIHAWFVENVQNGVDDCRDYEVSISDLETLLEFCKEVLTHKDKAADILPTQAGFFFGGTDYDEYYFHQCEETVKMLESILKEDNSQAHFTYNSSW